MAELIFSTLGDQSPVPVPDGYVTPPQYGAAAITNGAWNVINASFQATWLEETPLTNNMEVSVVFAAMNSNSRGIAISSAEGNGYLFLARNSDIRVFLFANGVLTGGAIATITMPLVTSDAMAVRPNVSTGLLTILVNGEEVGSLTNNTYVGETLLGGALSRGGALTSMEVKSLVVLPSISSVNEGNGVRAGSVGNTAVCTSGFTPTAGMVAGIPVLNLAGAGGDVTFDMPEVVEGDPHPGYGPKTVTFTNGVNSPSLAANYLPKAGYAYQTLSGTIDTSIQGLGFQFDPELTVDDQLVLPSPAVTIGATGGAPGTSAVAGTYEGEHISSVDNIVRFFLFQVGP